MATPTDHTKRRYKVFLRGPVPYFTFCFGTVDDIRAGLQHRAQLAVFPEPSDNPADDFGIIDGAGFTVEITDEGVQDWYVLDAQGDPINDPNLDFIVEAY